MATVPTASPTNAPSATASGLRSTNPTTAPTQDAIDPFSGLPWVDPADLPPDARTTMDLIASEGPYPYSQDGIVFENREGILPARPAGYYHEYTVETPGSADRGARRIVNGSNGEMYYTDDHYDSFRRIRT
jgi:ribonuclease T1